MASPIDDSDKLQRDALVKEAARRQFARSQTDSELEASVGDKKIKIRGSDILTTVIGMILAAGLTALLLITLDARAQAASRDATTAAMLEKTQDKVAVAMEKSQKGVADAILKLADEQRRSTEATKEGNCLLALPQDKRVNSAEICKRTSRDYR